MVCLDFTTIMWSAMTPGLALLLRFGIFSAALISAETESNNTNKQKRTDGRTFETDLMAAYSFEFQPEINQGDTRDVRGLGNYCQKFVKTHHEVILRLRALAPRTGSGTDQEQVQYLAANERESGRQLVMKIKAKTQDLQRGGTEEAEELRPVWTAEQKA